MTIQEALQKQRPFKRKNWNDEAWLVAAPSRLGSLSDLVFPINNKNYFATKEDVLANDWETKIEDTVYEFKSTDFSIDVDPGTTVKQVTVYLSLDQARHASGMSKVKSITVKIEGES